MKEWAIRQTAIEDGREQGIKQGIEEGIENLSLVLDIKT